MLILLVIYAKSFNTNQIHLIDRINRKQQLKPKTVKEMGTCTYRPALSQLRLIGLLVPVVLLLADWILSVPNRLSGSQHGTHWLPPGRQTLVEKGSNVQHIGAGLQMNRH